MITSFENGEMKCFKISGMLITESDLEEFIKKVREYAQNALSGSLEDGQEIADAALYMLYGEDWTQFVTSYKNRIQV